MKIKGTYLTAKKTKYRTYNITYLTTQEKTGNQNKRQLSPTGSLNMETQNAHPSQKGMEACTGMAVKMPRGPRNTAPQALYSALLIGN